MAFDQNSALGQSLTSATRIAFDAGFKQVQQGGRALYNFEQVDQLNKVYSSWVMDPFASNTGFGGNYANSNPTLGDEKTYTQNKITLSFEVIKEFNDFSAAANQPGFVEAVKKSQGIGTSAAKRIELDLQLNIGMGASASYTDMDGNTVNTTAATGLSNFNAAHTVNGSSATYSNVGSTAFGQTGLEAAELLFRRFINHDGQQITRRANTIFSTSDPTLTNLIGEFNKGMNHIADANRGINVYQGKYNHIVLEFMDATNLGAVDTAKKNYWGLAVAGDENLKLLVAQEPTVYAPEMVQRNRNILIQTDAVYTYGIQDPTCIVLMTA